MISRPCGRDRPVYCCSSWRAEHKKCSRGQLCRWTRCDGTLAETNVFNSPAVSVRGFFGPKTRYPGLSRSLGATQSRIVDVACMFALLQPRLRVRISGDLPPGRRTSYHVSSRFSFQVSLRSARPFFVATVSLGCYALASVSFPFCLHWDTYRPCILHDCCGRDDRVEFRTKFPAVVHIRFSVVCAHVCPPKRSLRLLVGCPRHAVVGLYISVKAGLHVMAEFENVHIVSQRQLRSCPSKCGSGRGVEVPPPGKNGGSTTRSGDGREEYSPSPR